MQKAAASKAANVHEALKPIAWLAGRWTTTEGRGKFPTMQDFKFKEDLEFTCAGDQAYEFVSSAHKTDNPNTPVHQERGYLRMKQGTNELGFAVSHNFGAATLLTSLEEGTYDPKTKTVSFETVNISRMAFSKQPHLTKFKRTFKLLDDGNLELIMFMETEKTPLTEHLRAVYKKA